MEKSLIHRFVEVNGVRLHIAEQGHGPLVLLLHGWPESWYSWRHQFGPLATAGYRVVAPEFARDITDTFRRLLVGASGDNPDGREPRPLVIPEGRGLLDMMPASPTLPAWLSEDDIRVYSEDFALHGDRAFTGAFNWY